MGLYHPWYSISGRVGAISRLIVFSLPLKYIIPTSNIKCPPGNSSYITPRYSISGRVGAISPLIVHYNPLKCTTPLDLSGYITLIPCVGGVYITPDTVNPGMGGLLRFRVSSRLWNPLRVIGTTSIYCPPPLIVYKVIVRLFDWGG